MAAELVLTTETEQDISVAYDWYEKRRDGLGLDVFLVTVHDEKRRKPLMDANKR